MDQFAIGMGKKDYAIKLNTNDLSYEYAKANLGDNSILIMNTNKKRELADSKYNERRQECDAALELLKTVVDINFLCDSFNNFPNRCKSPLANTSIANFTRSFSVTACLARRYKTSLFITFDTRSNSATVESWISLLSEWGKKITRLS